jgi:cytochrome c oxidase subunit 7c
MLARATFRAASAPSLVARRGFQSTRAQFSSPYHYPEGPRSNLPFDPLKRGFAFKYWGFMGELPSLSSSPTGQELTVTATGFSLPFLLAGETSTPALHTPNYFLTAVAIQCGRQRRTNKRDMAVLGHGFRPRQGQRICRILGLSANDCIDTTTSISLSVFTHLTGQCCEVLTRPDPRQTSQHNAHNAYLPRAARPKKK